MSRYTYRCAFGETFVVDTDKPPVYYDTDAPLGIALIAFLAVVLILVILLALR